MATDTHFDVNSLLQVRYPGTWKSARNSQCLSKVPVGICDRGRATACMCVLWLEHHSLIHRKITKKFLKITLKNSWNSISYYRQVVYKCMSYVQ